MLKSVKFVVNNTFDLFPLFCCQISNSSTKFDSPGNPVSNFVYKKEKAELFSDNTVKILFIEFVIFEGKCTLRRGKNQKKGAPDCCKERTGQLPFMEQRREGWVWRLCNMTVE